MPCRMDWTPNELAAMEHERHSRHGMDVDDFQAAMCGILRAAGDEILDSVDWDEAGVKRVMVEKWWKKHQAEDAARLKKEAAAKARKEKKERDRKTALAKLTNDERKALGL